MFTLKRKMENKVKRKKNGKGEEKTNNYGTIRAVEEEQIM